MKFLFQMIGFLVVIVILLSAVLFYMDAKDLLSGDLALLVRSMHQIYTQAAATLRDFMQGSGIADDAANLLDEGAERLRELTSSPEPTRTPGVIIEVTTPAP